MTDHLCRLDIRISPQDKALLRRRCDEFGMTQTDYMRMLINLPLRMVDEGMEKESDLFVIDRWGAGRIAGQIRRLGYQYNQGVHALNAIAYYLKRDEADSMDALDALESDHDYLTAGGVFPEELIANLINTKRAECSEMSKIPHPAEFDKYYNL